MTRIAYIADPHNGNHKKFGGPIRCGINERGHIQLEALRRSIEEARRLLCECFGVLGDMFDYVDVEPQLEAAVQDIFAKSEIPTFVMVGNHDQGSTSLGDHSLGPLSPVVDIIEVPQIVSVGDVQLWVVPFVPGPVLDWLPPILDTMSASRRREPHVHLCLHVGISDEKTAKFLCEGGGALQAEDLFVLMEKHDIHVAVSGDWHRHEKWDRNGRSIVQVGSLSPTRFPPNEHEHANIGPMVVVEDRTVLPVVSVPGPRFVKMHWGENYSYIKQPGDEVFVRITCKADEREAARAWLDEMKAKELIRDFAIEIERADTRAQLTAAHQRASSSQNVDAALKEFVEQMPVEDGVDKQRVLALTRGYLKA